MYLLGHLGAALLFYAPFSYVLVDRDRPMLAVFGGVCVLTFAMAPDVDLWLPFVSHRGPTHSLAFAVFFGALVGSLGRLVAAIGRRSEPSGGAFTTLGGTAGTLAVCSHLLADSITPRWRHAERLLSLEPFWPLAPWSVSVNLARAGDPALNIGTLCLGLTAVSISWFWTMTPDPEGGSAETPATLDSTD